MCTCLFFNTLKLNNACNSNALVLLHRYCVSTMEAFDADGTAKYPLLAHEACFKIATDACSRTSSF